MEVVLKKRGKSVTLVLPLAALKGLGIGAGQRMSLETTTDGKIVLSPKRKFALADMIAQCDQMAATPADIAGWEVARPIGQEVW